MNTGVIYCLHSTDPSAKSVYIGSTTNLRLRINVHRCDSKRKDSKIYNYINQYGGIKKWEFKILEEVKFTEKKELFERERYWCGQHTDLLNTQIPGRSMSEWTNDNADKIKKYQRERYQLKKQQQLAARIEAVC